MTDEQWAMIKPFAEAATQAGKKLSDWHSRPVPQPRGSAAEAAHFDLSRRLTIERAQAEANFRLAVKLYAGIDLPPGFASPL
jgi:hypothetical protein